MSTTNLQDAKTQADVLAWCGPTTHIGPWLNQALTRMAEIGRAEGVVIAQSDAEVVAKVARQLGRLAGLEEAAKEAEKLAYNVGTALEAARAVRALSAKGGR